MERSSSPNENIVYWDMDQLDKVANESHDGKSYSDGFADLCKFFLRRFCTTCQELVSVTNELLGYLDEFAYFVGHGDW